MRHAPRLLLLIAAFILLGGGLCWSEPAAGPQVGDMAPTFQATTLDKQRIDSAALRKGGRLVLVFWSSWCPHSQAHVPPAVHDLTKRFGDFDVAFLGINPVWLEDNEDKAQDFIDKYKINIPTIMDNDHAITTKFGVETVPTFFVIDKDGKISYRGEKPPPYVTLPHK